MKKIRFCTPSWDIQAVLFTIMFCVLGIVLAILGTATLFNAPFPINVIIPIVLYACAYSVFYLGFIIHDIDIWPFGWKDCND